jgi:3-(3-hydroxy-phenyl)propionate hydroxylase
MTDGMTCEPVPVLICGAGPTGLTLANLLGRYGVRTLLVERNLTTVQEPRAVSIDDESLRTLQAAGVVDQVLESVVPGYGSVYLGPSGRPFLEVKPTEVIYGYARRNAFRQPVLEAQLRQGLKRFAHVQCLFGWSLESFSQDDEGINYQLVGGHGQVRRGRAGFLVGCDGAASKVRTDLGLVLEGRTFSEKWLIVDLEASPAPNRDTLVFCDARRPCIALPGPDLTRRFEFKLLPAEHPDRIIETDTVARLLADHGADAGSVLKRKTVYTFHARLAPTWQVGRVFLAGDACHLTPPFAGQGMNSGLRDAHNLAWKLAAVVSGRLGRGVLDSYERERRDHVREMISLALRMGRIMGPPSRLRGALTRFSFHALNAYPPVRDYFAQMRYKPKPRFLDGFQLPDRRSARRTLVGRLLPQPEVRTRSGETVLLDTLMGDGFALLCVTEDPPAFAAAAHHDIWTELGAVRLAAVHGDPAAAAAGPVALVGGFPALKAYRRVKDLVLLVRPDRYVAAAFPLAEIEAYAVRIAELRDRTLGGSPIAMASEVSERPGRRLVKARPF